MCEQNYISYQISGHAFLPSSGIEIIGVFCSSFERFLQNLTLPTPAMTVMRTDKRESQQLIRSLLPKTTLVQVSGSATRSHQSKFIAED